MSRQVDKAYNDLDNVERFEKIRKSKKLIDPNVQKRRFKSERGRKPRRRWKDVA